LVTFNFIKNQAINDITDLIIFSLIVLLFIVLLPSINTKTENNIIIINFIYLSFSLLIILNFTRYYNYNPNDFYIDNSYTANINKDAYIAFATFAIASYKFLVSNKLKKFLHFIIAVISFIVVIKLQSVVVIVSLPIFLILTFIYKIQNRKLYLFLKRTFWIIFFISNILIFFFLPKYPEFDILLNGRNYVWEQAIQKIISNPLGYGYYASWGFFILPNGIIFESSHDIILDSVLMLGFIGAFIYLYFIIKKLINFQNKVYLIQMPEKNFIIFLFSLNACTLTMALYHTIFLGRMEIRSIIALIFFSLMINQLKIQKTTRRAIMSEQ